MSTSKQVIKINKQTKSGITKLGLWYGFLIAVLALGLGAFVIRATQGLATTNLTSAMPWGAWVAFYIYFVGMSAGAFLLSSLIHVFDMEHLEDVGKDATLVAIISMVLALCFILMDLGHMERLFNALWYFNPTSILSWEIRFYVIYILLLFAEFYFALRYDLVIVAQGEGFKAKLAKIFKLGSTNVSEEGKKRDQRWLKILGSIGIPIAIFGVHGGTGVLFAVVKAQPYWNTALFPVVFVISALVSGTALITALYVIRSRLAGKEPKDSLVQSLAGWMILFLIIDVGLQFFEILVGMYGLEEQELATLTTIFASDFSWVFWLVQFGIGIVIPLVLYFYSPTRKSATAMMLAGIAVVIGILGVRFNIVVPALMVPAFSDLPIGQYYPTWIEWAISSGIISLGMLLYTLAINYLPVDVE